MTFEIDRPTYIKDAPPRVFDTHVHYPFRQQRNASNGLPIYTAEGMLDMLAYNCQRLNIYRVCLLGRPGEGNDLVEKALERYPNLVVPFAMVDVDQSQPAEITDFGERGFRGLKIINPRRNYDDPAYFPLYAEAMQYLLNVLRQDVGGLCRIVGRGENPETGRGLAHRRLQQFGVEAGDVAGDIGDVADRRRAAEEERR